MHSGLNHEVIFDGEREAKLAVHLLNQANRTDLVCEIEPPLVNKELTFMEYLVLITRKDSPKEYIFPAEKASELLLTLGRVAIPSENFNKHISPEHYIGNSMLGFISTVSEDAPYAVFVRPDY